MSQEQEFPIGTIVNHGLDEDDGPSVGYSVRLNEAGDELWVGEISRSLFDEHGLEEHFPDDNGWWIVHFPSQGEATVFGRTVPWPDSQSGEELIRILALGFHADAAAKSRARA